MPRNSWITRSFLALPLLAMLAALVLRPAPAPAAEPRPLRVLTIGNSFADNASRFLPDIAKADGSVQLILGKANIGGCSLEKHATLAAQSDKDPSVKPYKRSRGGKTESLSLDEYLKSEPWDVVTLQQLSALSYQPESFHPHIDQLVERVKKHAPTAKILIHQTWAYRSDSPLLKQDNLTQEEMYKKLSAAYAGVAKRYGTRLIPAGDAFQNARETPGRRVAVPDPKFDYKNPVYPNLPDQTHSLVVGWFWQKSGDTPKLALDYKHANNAGCYLLGAVWFETLTGRDIRPNSFRPPGVEPGDVDFLKNIAHETVARPRTNP